MHYRAIVWVLLAVYPHVFLWDVKQDDVMYQVIEHADVGIANNFMITKKLKF